ncbi:MAG: sigma-54 dependent transcriptional regulator [Bacteroidales bacterium]|nr:sigma-54 dependent transcriptional regulator [Bacteroidales bacterium]MCL2132723.1 sigma-54 dependent transcriptional regulator [Bacteroidales bacterium]
MRILVVDDEKSIRNTMKDILSYEGHEVVVAEKGAEVLHKVAETPFDLIFCDIKMPEMDGVEVLEQLQQRFPELPVVMISGHGTIDVAVDCIRKGAYDFIEKPLDLNRILIALRNGTEKTALVKETKVLKRKISKLPDIIGGSEAIQKIKEMIDRVAPTEARVLITGANGTGKELVARWLHEKSTRIAAPFVEVNCAAIPGELIESELFGHEKGSFTSAVRQHKGKFEQANGGTLFLDEIGDMSPSAQAKVLRALQENRITRIGSDKDINVDVRVIAATNKNLQLEIERGTFREDLYHRLGVILIRMPSLSERKDDISIFAHYFIRQICDEYGYSVRKITDDALIELQKYPWTGNIREFRNAMERLIILCDKRIGLKEVKTYVNPLFL